MTENKIATIERKTVGCASIVTLKSGGPKMTVTERTADKAHCLWHGEDGELCSFWFPLAVLEVK